MKMGVRMGSAMATNVLTVGLMWCQGTFLQFLRNFCKVLTKKGEISALEGSKREAGGEHNRDGENVEIWASFSVFV
jgi:hypothetical protein